MTLAQIVGQGITIPGLPPFAWAFALRIWTAMMPALFAAFRLQHGNPSSTAVTVGVLAVQKRGPAYQKALYWIFDIIIGLIVAGLFPQTRDLFIAGFTGWFELCAMSVAFCVALRNYCEIWGYPGLDVVPFSGNSPATMGSASIPDN